MPLKPSVNRRANWRLHRSDGLTALYHAQGLRGAKRRSQRLGVRGADEVSTTFYCIHIRRAMKGAGKWSGIFRPVNEFEDTNVC